MTGVTWSILNPPAGHGAIGVVQLRAPDEESMNRVLSRAGLPARLGAPVLADLLGVDRGLAVRWDERTVDLFPHGGPAVVRALARALGTLGVSPAGAEDAAFPEAADEIEARMLAVLPRAASPLAVDLLLDQPRRWREHAEGRGADAGEADARVLGRLLDPPLVVAVGPPNIGKSTLLNRLAGRSVAIVADVPGTTRDHVGVTLELDGLAVRYLDTPGLLEGAGGADRDAIRLATRVMDTADLVLACGDPTHTPPAVGGDRGVIRVCLRRDLGEPVWGGTGGGASGEHGPDASVCARDGTGVDGLARLIRARLVPDGALADPRPWRFWGADGPGNGAGP